MISVVKNAITILFTIIIVTNAEPLDTLQSQTIPIETINQSSLAPAVSFSSEPKMVSEGVVEMPLDVLLKKGIKGEVIVNIDIDQKGTIERCLIIQGVDPLLDSLVVSSLYKSIFSPAFNDGRAVPSTITMNYVFDPKIIAEKSGDAIPAVSGIVLENETSLPVKGAKVNLQLADSFWRKCLLRDRWLDDFNA